MSEPTLNQRWAAELIGSLVAGGVRHAVIAPGSRSTPLALACADRPDLRVWSVIDERSAAFFGLGLAKSKRAPVAVICTSGTAGAHFLPAVIEAGEGAMPLVLLTADRPWELHGFGSPQTIEQTSLFGRYVRVAESLPSPDEQALGHLGSVVGRAMMVGRDGPIHFNVPFREPLAAPDGSAGPVVNPRVPCFSARRSLPDLSELERAIRASERGLIICGPRERDDAFGVAVHRLGAKLGFPVLAEAASNARYGFPDAITWYDAMVRHTGLARSLAPDLVVRFGGGLTSKYPQQWLDASSAKTFVVAEDDRLFDPSHRAVGFVAAGAPELCAALERSLPAGQQSFRERFLQVQRELESRVTKHDSMLTEPFIARALVETLPEGASLFVSSSMPIRDVDAFATKAQGRLRVFSNRGVNGIDGVTSTALGVAAGTGSPTALLVGDVALLHDLSGWLIAKKHQLSLTVVCVNNDGGGIFQFLPVADRTPHFEALFGTPHGVDLSHLAALAGATLHRPSTVEAYRRAVQQGISGGGLHLIEARTERRANVDHHRALYASLTEGMS